MYQVLADIVLVVHLAIVLFVVGGLVLIVAGGLRGWQWTASRLFRFAHVAAIGVVVAQAWMGQACPLTTLESWLRLQAGGKAYEASFIEHWVQAVLFYSAPPWVFTAIYTLFAGLVFLAWRGFPPKAGSPAQRDGNV